MGDKENKKRIYISIAAVIGVLAIFGIIFIQSVAKLGWFKSKIQPAVTVQNNSVIFEQPRLNIFDDTTYLNQYPDEIRVHDDYFLVVKPYETKTYIYSLEQKKKIKEIPEVVLDYDGTNVVYNKNGLKTTFNSTDLGVLCLSAFIKDPEHLLCVTKVNDQSMETKLVNISPITKAQQIAYNPAQPSVITSVAVIKGIQYLGFLEINSLQNNLAVNGQVLPVEGSVDVIYPMKNQVYFASNKKNNKDASYWIINQNGAAFSVSKVGVGKIVFY